MAQKAPQTVEEASQQGVVADLLQDYTQTKYMMRNLSFGTESQAQNQDSMLFGANGLMSGKSDSGMSL